MSVTGTNVGHFGPGGSQSLSVLVEYDVSLSLNELKKNAKPRVRKESKGVPSGRDGRGGGRDRHRDWGPETYLALLINPVDLSPPRIPPL